MQGMVAHACFPTTQEEEAGESRQPGLQGEFQNSQGYIEKPCTSPYPTPTKKRKEKRKKKKKTV